MGSTLRLRAIGTALAEGLGVRDCDRKDQTILNTILALLVILWLLGMISSYTLGGYLHLLLILAIGMVLIRVINGRRPI
jgi:hypothetical protein